MTNKNISTLRQGFQRQSKRKRPLSITLIIAWMVFMIFKNFLKLFDTSRLERNASILGQNMAYFNYIADVFFLLVFVILICLFLLRTRNAWKYFAGTMALLIIGNLVGMLYIPQFIASLPSESQSFIFIFTLLGDILVILFYLFLAYIVYRRRKEI